MSEIHDDHGYIGRWSTSGQLLAEFQLPTLGFTTLAWGPDGNVWFSGSVNGCYSGGCFSGSYIGRLTPDGTITRFALPDPHALVQDLVAGPDRALWFTEGPGANIGRINTQGVITEFAVPGATANTGDRAAAQDITVGPDGALWATLEPVGIVRIATDGSMHLFATPLDMIGCCVELTPRSITAGPTRSLWFTVSFETSTSIGRMSTSGEVAVYHVPNDVATEPVSVITAGPDDAVWFDDGMALVRLSARAPATTPSPTSAMPSATRPPSTPLVSAARLIGFAKDCNPPSGPWCGWNTDWPQQEFRHPRLF